jgi:hypothetical protein
MLTPKFDRPSALLSRFIIITKGASNSAGVGASPERRVAPSLDDDQDTKDEHQPRQPDERRQERRRRECKEQYGDCDEPRHAERGVHALLEDQVPGEVEREPPIQSRGIEEAQRLTVTGMRPPSS